MSKRIRTSLTIRARFISDNCGVINKIAKNIRLNYLTRLTRWQMRSIDDEKRTREIGSITRKDSLKEVACLSKLEELSHTKVS